MDSNGTLAWGILGTGKIAKRLARGIAESISSRLVAVASRTRAVGEAFARDWQVGRCHTGYQQLLDDPAVQVVYVALPHPLHAEWTLKAIRAGKHVLVEKPMALNLADGEAMVDAARVRGVTLMEAFMYRCHPQTAALLDIIRSGQLGTVRFIQATFGYLSGDESPDRAAAQDKAEGGILDVGCYPVSMARLVAGAAAGLPFLDPVEVKACGRLNGFGCDDWSSATLAFANGIVAQVATARSADLCNEVRVYGSHADLVVHEPWVPGLLEAPWAPSPSAAQVTISVHERWSREVRRVTIPCDRDLYAYEVDALAAAVAAGSGQAAQMPWDDSLGNLRTLDRWRAEVGLVYDCERPEQVPTLTREPLVVEAAMAMPRAAFPGIAKPASRLVLGTAFLRSMPEAAPLYDEFFRRGGNVFDTSTAYGQPNGTSERLLGQWIRNRGVRDRVVVVEKGANAPNHSPEGLTRELLIGLERLQMDSVDLYLIHRDYGTVPMDEWIDVLNQHQRAGRITAFGVSNFPLERIQQGQAHAQRTGQSGFSVISNQYSLAQMLAPVWEGCRGANDPQSREWFTRTQTPLLPWSSQARGYFATDVRATAGNDEFARCWDDAANRARKERAERLAAARGCDATTIALAWVLHQPFPTFPMIGPLRLSELRSSCAALDLRLTAEELRWLDEGGAMQQPGAAAG